jgi:Recombination endonuclease VII
VADGEQSVGRRGQRAAENLSSEAVEEKREVFLARVLQEDDTGCWIYQGPGIKMIKGKPWPGIWVRGSQVSALRFSWILHTGGFPKGGWVVGTTCGRELCVSPDHLIVTGPHGMTTAGLRRCPRCREVKDPADFAVRLGMKPRRYCSDCHYVYTAARRYGVTESEIRELFERNQWRCTICRKENNSVNKRLNVDHDHKTGAIRGLLCDNCNQVLARSNEDVKILQSAIDYLQMLG